jgi:hypothetical protein
MTGYIYCLKDSSGEIFYVGATDDPYKREISHKSSVKKGPAPVYEHIRSNKISFSLKVIKKIEYIDRFQLLDQEAKYINKMLAKGYNLKNSDFVKNGRRKNREYGSEKIELDVFKKAKNYCVKNGLLLNMFIQIAIDEKLKRDETKKI